MAQEKKIAPDWERIEADYRAGLLSVREIAASQGVSHVAIAKRAKRDGWVRDLGQKIKAKADSLVTNQAVTTSVTTEKAVTDKAIVEANAVVIANIRIAHRTDIARSRALAMSLLGELETQTGNLELFDQIEKLLNEQYGKDGEKATEAALAKLNEGYRKALSLSGRASMMKSLADTLKTLIALEREAYNVGDGTPPPTALPTGPKSSDPIEAARIYHMMMTTDT